MIKKDSFYLRHILDSADLIAEFIRDIDPENFSDNKLVQSAVIRQIEIIGEAAKKVSQDLKDQFASIPWKQICGMRDKLIHDYFGVDLDAVWDTAFKDIPDLKIKIEEILISL